MNQNALEILEFEKIRTELKGYALSDMAKEVIDKLEPSLDKRKIERWLLETTEARNIVDRSSSVPLHSLTGIDKIKEKLGKTAALQPEELEAMASFLKDCIKLRSFMLREDFQYLAPNISSYAASIYELEDLVQEIERCIDRGRVDDKASSNLSKLRKRINILEERIRAKVEAAMRNPKYKNYIQDSLISIRNGRFVIPIIADIGDGQSIEQSLSTFSSHIKNIINIINCADKHSLVILDEVGAGTDPGEGMGIAVAVLEEIQAKGAVMLATTHYSEIKEFAEKTPGFRNGCMEFDINTLKPLYRLVVGRPGESNAFLIALRLGMNKELIERAHRITYKEEKKYDSLLVEDKEEGSVLEEAIREHHEEKLEKLKENIKMDSIAEKLKAKPKFKVGDCVYISTMDRTGIVCEPENNKGEVTVMVMRKKFKINHKRLSLYIDSEELYPEDYDFDIVFESKEKRKKKKLMTKRHVEGVVIDS